MIRAIYVNLLGETNITKKNTEAVLEASMDVCLEVYAEKIAFMFTSHEHTTGKNRYSL
jgi:hypothetical protein